ncbi:hypothetical protein ANRL1_02507 [Anaerolineae bacterium]|nr:hypothetical protein ANRL1_02507 [Anaerolineae bacterium]
MASVEEELEAAKGFLHAPLRQYQWEGVSFLYRNSSALLADEMGLGKTVQAIIALSLCLRKPDVGRALIVAPASLALNWERELARWAPHLVVRRLMGSADERNSLYLLPVEVVVGTYDQMRLDALDNIPADTFDLVLLDEAQRIKNADSQVAFACKLLSRRISWALSATPLENSRAELHSVFDFVRPGLLTNAVTKDELFSRLAPHMLRRRKSIVMGELPPIQVQDLVLELTDEQRLAYDRLWYARQEGLPSDEEDAIPVTSLFALLTKLKQACNYDPKTNSSSKLELVRTIVESARGPLDKIIIFSQFVETLTWLGQQLDAIDCELYHGGLSLAERDEVIARFENAEGPRVLLMSLRAGGLGLNLEAASVVVLFDRWWNPAAEAQAISRAHRFARKRPLHAVRLLVKDSVEERIDKILRLKQELFDEYIENAPGPDVERLTKRELLRILELHPSPRISQPSTEDVS